MFNRVENLENNVQGIIFSSILRIEVQTFESDFWTPISPSEKAISECFRSSCGSVKKRSTAGLPEFTVN